MQRIAGAKPERVLIENLAAARKCPLVTGRREALGDELVEHRERCRPLLQAI